MTRDEAQRLLDLLPGEHSSLRVQVLRRRTGEVVSVVANWRGHAELRATEADALAQLVARVRAERPDGPSAAQRGGCPVSRALTVAAVLDGLSPDQREALLRINPHLRPVTARATARGELVEAHAHRDGVRVTVVAKGLRLDATPNARAHWSTTATKRARERQVIARALAGITPPAGPWRVTITRIGPRVLDDDNRTASAKGCRDAVAAWLGIDDGDERAAWEVRGEVARGYAVRVQIEGSV